MRTNTKLKKILQEHTVGLSYTENWEMTTINLQTRERKQFNGQTFSQMVSKAYSDFEKSRKNVQRILY